MPANQVSHLKRRWRTKIALLPTLLLALFAGTSIARGEIIVSRIELGLPNTAVFLVSGRFDGNEILRFKSAIADVPPTVRIMAALNSGGGRVDQGFALGKFFYDARIPTIVLAGHVCASACTDVFFGGRDPITGKSLRIMASGAKLGFHNFASSAPSDRTYTKDDLITRSRIAQQVINANLIYLRSVEAPIRSIVLNLETGNKEMRYLTESEALEFDITILNLETGRLVSPANLARRTR